MEREKVSNKLCYLLSPGSKIVLLLQSNFPQFVFVKNAGYHFDGDCIFHRNHCNVAVHGEHKVHQSTGCVDASFVFLCTVELIVLFLYPTPNNVKLPIGFCK